MTPPVVTTETVGAPVDIAAPVVASAIRLPLTSEDIRRILPHRWPFLFLDRVVELEPGVRAVGIKNVSVSEPYFAGHLPMEAIMPGVLTVETAAQLCGIVIATNYGPDNPVLGTSFAFLAGVKKMRFRKPVRPGDQMIIDAVRAAGLANVVDFRVNARVDGVIVADGLITFAGRELTSGS